MRNDLTPQRDPPPDDVVVRAAELYARLRNKAEQSILGVYPFVDNRVNGTVVAANGMEGHKIKLLIRFSVNGREVDCQKNVDRDYFLDKMACGKGGAFDYLRHEAAQAIAETIVGDGRFGEDLVGIINKAP